MNNLLHLQPPALPAGGEFSPVPRLDDIFLRNLRDSGYSRVGIVAALVEDGKILMLHHKPSDKSAAAWGPLAETTKATRTESGWQIEDPVHTLRRAIHEEIGMQVGFPELKARAIGGFTMSNWPVGIRYPGQVAYAIVPVLHMATGATNHILGNYRPTQETNALAMLSPGEIRSTDSLRPGVLKWLQVVENSPLFDGNGPLVPLPPAPTMPSGGVDVLFERMSL